MPDGGVSLSNATDSIGNDPEQPGMSGDTQGRFTAPQEEHKADTAFLRNTNREDFAEAVVKHSGNEQLRGIAAKFYDSLMADTEAAASAQLNEVELAHAAGSNPLITAMVDPEEMGAMAEPVTTMSQRFVECFRFNL